MSDTIKDILFESIELGDRGSLLSKRLTTVLKNEFPNVESATATNGCFFSITMVNSFNFYFHLGHDHFSTTELSVAPVIGSDEEMFAQIKKNNQIKEDANAIFEFINSNYKEFTNGK